MLETGFAHIAQALLWPVLILVALGFLYALWIAGATLMEAMQRRKPDFRTLRVGADATLETLELQIVRELEPQRLLGRVAPLLGLIATMVPLGPALQSVAAGQGSQALAVFSSAFSGVVLALAAAAIALIVYSIRRRWLLAELLVIKSEKGLGMSRRLSILTEEDDDPMLSAVNLVDVFLVLVVALLTAVALQQQSSSDETVIRRAGQPDMEIVVRKNGQEIKYRGNGGSAEGQGERAGVAYRMKDGSIIYVPEAGEAGAPVAAPTGGAGGGSTAP